MAGQPFGLRAQILLGLAMVTLFAVLWTSYLALWAGGDSLRLQRQSTALALATAAGTSAAAVAVPGTPLGAPENRGRLDGIARDLTAHGDTAQVSFIALDHTVVASRPPRAPGDVDPPIVTAALSGAVPTVQNYRTGPGGETELLAYAPIGASGSVLGAVRVVLPGAAPVLVVIRRSGWVLLMLAVADALLVMALGYLVLTRLIVRPLQAMETATARVSAGEWELAVATSGPREVTALASAFNRMTASLVSQREQLIRTEKLASVGALAAGVAHEIGNPLAAILGFADLLRDDGMSPEDRRDLLERVRSETQRIHRIIQDLLEYSRPSRDDAQPTDPLKILRASQGLLEPQKRFRSVRVVVATPEDTTDATWPRVMVSPGRLQQVFVNLFINAADAMEGEGTIDVSCVADGDRVRVTFADTGPGVPADLRRKIFDPFFTTKPPGQGTGLGLAICRSIVESYGGTLELDPGTEGGARFVIDLPAAP